MSAPPEKPAPLACRSHGCKLPAVFEVYWPGQTTIKCAICCLKACQIASAMGFDLAFNLLEDGEAAPS